MLHPENVFDISGGMSPLGRFPARLPVTGVDLHGIGIFLCPAPYPSTRSNSIIRGRIVLTAMPRPTSRLCGLWIFPVGAFCLFNKTLGILRVPGSVARVNQIPVGILPFSIASSILFGIFRSPSAQPVSQAFETLRSAGQTRPGMASFARF